MIVRAVRTFPCASRNVAASCNESPCTSVPVAGVTSTVATGASTNTTVASLTPPAVARMVASPDEAAVTTPAPVTAATDGALDAHCTAVCAELQCCAVTAAVSVMVSPTMTGRATCETCTALTLHAGAGAACSDDEHPAPASASATTTT